MTQNKYMPLGYFKEFFSWPTWSTSVTLEHWLRHGSQPQRLTTRKTAQDSCGCGRVCPRYPKGSLSAVRPSRRWHHEGRALTRQRFQCRVGAVKLSWDTKQSSQWSTHLIPRPGSSFSHLRYHTPAEPTVKSHLPVPESRVASSV